MTTEAVDVLETAMVWDVMHPGVVTCPPETPLREVAGMMARHRIHALVVFADVGEADETVGLWGVVSDLDLIRVAAVGDVGGRTAGATARSPLVTVSPDELLLRAVELMQEHAVTHLVVVAPMSKQPIGIVSSLDVARAIAQPEHPREVLRVHPDVAAS